MAETAPTAGLDAAASFDGVNAGAILTIDLGAIRRNYRYLCKEALPSRTAAVVKANAYGCGIEAVVPALYKEGCRTFFTALPDEAVRVRETLDGLAAEIYVLDGLLGAPADYVDSHLRPVIGDPYQMAVWNAHPAIDQTPAPYALHLDTGMSRLGIRHDALPGLRAKGVFSEPPALLITHMACADDPAHPLNRVQINRFDKLHQHFLGVPTSLANSAAVLAGVAKTYDLARPGIALYGGRALIDGDNPMEPVVRVDARILQVRTVEPGETVGYGATWTAKSERRIAIVAAGYADGYLRHLSQSDTTRGGMAAILGKQVPAAGRVSMDLTAFDVTDVEPGVLDATGALEIIGPTITADDIADRAGTIGYEILTGLSARYHHRIIDTEN